MGGERRAIPHGGSSSDALPSMQERRSWQAAAGREEAIASKVSWYWKELGKQQFFSSTVANLKKNKTECNCLLLQVRQGKVRKLEKAEIIFGKLVCLFFF